MLAFNVLQLEEHSERNGHFAFLNVPKSEEQSETHQLIAWQMFHVIWYMESQPCATNSNPWWNKI